MLAAMLCTVSHNISNYEMNKISNQKCLDDYVIIIAAIRPFNLAPKREINKDHRENKI